jgi:nitrite reductase/ring-hydroxylating ferredoxin subunit/uncharacterized membrane protein
MESRLPTALVELIEGIRFIDPVSERLQKLVRSAVPAASGRKDLLSGTWLGHPLHPLLTDVVIGAWTSAAILDVAGGEGAEQAADGLVAVGILAAGPTVATGASDWAELRGPARRVGSVHAIGNSTALALHALSLLARRRGDRRRGVALSLAGFGVAGFAAFLGGDLSFARGVGVNQTAFEDVPKDWTAVAEEGALADGKLVGVQANGAGVLLVRRAGRVHALLDRCSHRGCALHRGVLNGDDTVTCPCHGSTFRLDGSIVKGPATSPQPSLAVRTTAEGAVEVMRPT